MTDLLVFITTKHVGDVPAAAQSPPHPVKVAPELGVAVSVTRIPEKYVSLQSPGQVIRSPVTVPGPVTSTVRVAGDVCTGEDSASLVIAPPAAKTSSSKRISWSARRPTTL